MYDVLLINNSINTSKQYAIFYSWFFIFLSFVKILNYFRWRVLPSTVHASRYSLSAPFGYMHNGPPLRLISLISFLWVIIADYWLSARPSIRIISSHSNIAIRKLPVESHAEDGGAVIEGIKVRPINIFSFIDIAYPSSCIHDVEQFGVFFESLNIHFYQSFLHKNVIVFTFIDISCLDQT